MSASSNHVYTEDRGTMRVGEAGVMLDGVVYAFDQGESPESICQQYPGLTLEEVYGAITHYLARGGLRRDHALSRAQKRCSRVSPEAG
jgi:uncharacterized protein (DUF433 family)